MAFGGVAEEVSNLIDHSMDLGTLQAKGPVPQAPHVMSPYQPTVRNLVHHHNPTSDLPLRLSIGMIFHLSGLRQMTLLC